jgi:hypothetical protein
VSGPPIRFALANQQRRDSVSCYSFASKN